MDQEIPRHANREDADSPMSSIEPLAEAVQFHDEVWQLLPWLANGSLEGSELVAVLDHLKVCETCREELLFLPELRFLVEQTDSLDDGPAPRPEALLERIERYEAKRDPGSMPSSTSRRSRPIVGLGRPGSWLSGWLAGPWGPPVALGQTLLLILFVVFAWLRPFGLGPDPDATQGFETLSQEQPRGPRSTVEGAAKLRLVFDGELSERELRILLQGIDGTVVDGPNTVGAYTVRLGSTELGDILSRLRQHPGVVLAEAVVGP